MTRSDEPGLGVMTSRIPLALKAGFWACIAISVAIVVRRLVALQSAPGSKVPAQLATLDAYFRAHAALTYIHILCALGFVLLLPLIFWKRTRESAVIQQAFSLLGAGVGITAYAMSAHAVGGWLERSAVLVFDTLFLFALCRAYLARSHGDGEQQCRWTLRSVAIVLGIATTRPIMGIFFATARLTGLTPAQFFGIAFWIGFSLNTLVVELWLRGRASRIEAHPTEHTIKP